MRREAAIREVFLTLDRTTEHRISRVARILGLKEGEIVRRIEAGQLEARAQRGDYVVAWPEIATLAMQRWSIVVIEGELGERAPELLPPLLITRKLTLTLPGYQVEMLQRLARRRRVTIDAFLTDHLLDLAGSVAEGMERAVPGFIEAMRFPDA